MRFFRFATPLAFALVSMPLAGLIPPGPAYAQETPNGAAPGNNDLPGVTIPPQSHAPDQPLPPLPERHVETPPSPGAKPQEQQQQAQTPPAPLAAPPTENLSPAAKIDSLLAQLKRESNPDKAKSIAEEIQTDWSESGSPTVDLLLQWASEAVEKKNNGAALDFLDRATIIDPDFTGAWHQRATLHYTMGDPRKAMADISEVLKREPRHFGAIAGMVAILMEAEEDGAAEKALAQYLAIYPADRQAREQMEKLSEKIAGSRT
ncbi:tetratricopeptide (TPR) repeat protein [Neorhizobium huautlense]|uniref:Tetratricopeptide (TPR) repeat protein n=1 Tax=Neorhizobium huautlense TaxID=67774 RepID=A0ABT9PPZ0_9HYPH|nr:tetratricopeptide repeat protein [Neorhizobium huautlense]MDP9836193.1 tetratricopeptide (TPR) repeat protein [Neorhizobium huautlense]